MKQVRYDYTLKEVAAALAAKENLDDGWWNVGVVFEQVGRVFPPMDSQQAPDAYPGIMARVVQITLTPVEAPNTPAWYPHAIEVRDGVIIMERNNGIDRDNSRPIESSEGPGGYSRPVEENSSRSRRYHDGIGH
jgi:hypothetical protein